MKKVGAFFLSLTVISITTISNVLAGRPGIYQRLPDPEGQFPRLGACPDDHACIFPPDVSQFLPGAYFDLRVELHAYDRNTSNPAPEPYTQFKTTVRKDDGPWTDANEFFATPDIPALEYWNFTWAYSAEAHYSKEEGGGKKPIDVNVSSRVWRKLKFDEPGRYDVSVQYSPKEAYTVRYTVIEPRKPERKAKNAILFIADGCNIGMITAARAVARKTTSGKFVNGLLSFEDFDELGHIITHSVDGLVTDSSNSASSYATGHKASVQALGVYGDSSPSQFDDPKVELVTELIRRRQPGKAVGIVTTAFVQDATPGAFYSHTRRRGTLAEITDQLVHGVPDWLAAVEPDVLMGGGAEYFKGEQAVNETDYYALLQDKYGYQVVMNKQTLNAYNGQNKLLGIFRKDVMDVWLERNIFINNTADNAAAPDLSGDSALGSDQPGLDDMTLKALEVLKKRGGDDGFFLMSEAASVDKRLHQLDFPRAWADLIELDVTIKKTIEWLKKNGEYEDTLILVTADHSHSYDVFGTVDQQFLDSQTSHRNMRNAVGIYDKSGWPGFSDEDQDGFPDNWDPRITLASGSTNGPDHFEAWKLSSNGYRNPFIMQEEEGYGKLYVENPEDPSGSYAAGLRWNGNIPVHMESEVHSMADVAIYSNGPGSHLFKKTMENWSLFFRLTEALDLQHPTINYTDHKQELE
ncbi:alkaline-phosphatase-like protein [Zychaea mexicana]|uniref:alkaline-phosphatase-like protein n=1 Tax=Zychaea mexicana TaxID=64656 RepID=UPI0022FE1BDA|nr:alkaline-phosphatase-like protein [Zychaea mexicana]KAI9490802.1 alkaline-phosphatase-like protein [Zychaea mexicana]